MVYKRKLDFDEMPAKRSKIQAVRTLSKGEASMEELRREQKRLKSKISTLSKSRETKHFDIVEGPDNISYAVNNTYTLCFPGQGASKSNRIGDTISPTFLRLKGYLYNDTAAAFSLVRVTLIRSKKNFVPSTITSGTVVSAYLTSAADDKAVVSQWNIQNREDFQVLHDEVVKVSQIGTESEIAHFEINRKLSGKIIFDTESATPQAGQLYLCVTSSTTGVNGPQLNFTSRVYYRDD